MTSHANPAVGTPPDLTLTNTFVAPRTLLFEVWTNPEHLKQWWGPHHFSAPICELDVRVGGALRIVMRGPDETMYPIDGSYTEVAPPERLSWISVVNDQQGVFSFEILNTVTFAEADGVTTQTLTAWILRREPSADVPLAGMRAGWTQTLEKLARFVTTVSEEGSHVRV